jgi:hypothetical protein
MNKEPASGLIFLPFQLLIRLHARRLSGWKPSLTVLHFGQVGANDELATRRAAATELAVYAT